MVPQRPKQLIQYDLLQLVPAHMGATGMAAAQRISLVIISDTLEAKQQIGSCCCCCCCGYNCQFLLFLIAPLAVVKRSWQDRPWGAAGEGRVGGCSTPPSLEMALAEDGGWALSLGVRRWPAWGQTMGLLHPGCPKLIALALPMSESAG